MPLNGRSFVAVVATLSSLSCASTQRTSTENANSRNRFEVKVVAATIPETKLDGTPWHTEEPEKGIPIFTNLVTLSMGPVAGALASAILPSENSTRNHPPSPFVRVQIGENLFTTLTRRSTFTPDWNYSFAVDVRDFKPESPVVFTVVDADGGAPIETFETNVGKLLSKQDPPPFNGETVKSLQIHITPLPDIPEPKFYDWFRVPSTVTLEALASRTGPPVSEDEWRAVPVLNGDFVRIRAKGEIHPSTNHFPKYVCGPNGSNDRDWRDYNRDDFKDINHAALVAYVGGEPIPIGDFTEFRVKGAGRLLLGVNDRDVANNSGEYLVQVEVNPEEIDNPNSGRHNGPSFVGPNWKQKRSPDANPQEGSK